jgi:cobalamin biosynthesis protein CobW
MTLRLRLTAASARVHRGQVTLITGFLGAGKSTLVAHVLSAAHGRRVAVVVNEFGAGLGLDKLLVQDGAADRCVRGHVCQFVAFHV